jgi:hypothetical protein
MPERGHQHAGRAATLLTHRLAVFIVAAVLLGAVAMLPFVLAGVVGQIVGGNGPNFPIFSSNRSQPDEAHLNLKLTSLDEWNRSAQLLVSGIRVCGGPCTTTDRIQLISIPPAADKGFGLPPYQTIAFTPNQRSVTQEIKLPVSGDATRYPFDGYRLELGVVFQRVLEDGTVQALSPQDADGSLFLSVTGSIPKTDMGRPAILDPGSVPPDDPAYRYVSISELALGRPLYLRAVSVVLVLLVSLAAAYAVFVQPFEGLVANVGWLVLGLWGLRAILLGSEVPGYTALDLSLMVVILFLLLAITWRALGYLRRRAGLAQMPPA